MSNQRKNLYHLIAEIRLAEQENIFTALYHPQIVLLSFPMLSIKDKTLLELKEYILDTFDGVHRVYFYKNFNKNTIELIVSHEEYGQNSNQSV